MFSFGADGLLSGAIMASAMVMCLDRWERQELMCLTTHFTAKLLKSCAVYTPTFEYLSSGQFNYPPFCYFCCFVVSPLCTRLERCVCGFIKIRRWWRCVQGAKKIKYFIPSVVSHAVLSLPPPYIYRYCTRSFSYKVI